MTMTVSPDYTQTLSDVRDCTAAILAELTASANISKGVLYQQVTPNFFTIQPFLRGRLRRSGTELVEGELTVRIVYRGGYVTEGGAVEAAVQDMAFASQFLFMERPQLQSEAFPNGVTGVDPDGLTEVSVDVGEVPGSGAEQTRVYGFVLVLTLSLLFELDTLEF
jgi:hypothetical protein